MGVVTRAWTNWLLTTTVLALVAAFAPAAAAHEGAGEDYRSEVTSMGPEAWPIFVEVRDGDDQLWVSNTGDEDLIVYGYEDGQPWLRIGPDGVFINTNSKDYYSNSDRCGEADLPDGIGEGPPEWERQDVDAPAFEYHDHRIHWMLRTPPPQVDESDSAEQPVFDWSVPVSYGGEESQIEGELVYIGGGSDVWPWLIAAVGGGLLVLALAGWGTLRRRRSPSERRQ